MQMTESEIKTNILQAKDQIAQVSICAQLNGVPTEKIRDILRKQGVDLRTLRGSAAKRGWKRDFSSAPAKTSESAKDDEKIILQLFNRVNELTAQREAINSELLTIKAKLVKIMSAIDGGENHEKP